MKLFNIFKKKNEVKESNSNINEEQIEETNIVEDNIEVPEVIKVKCIRTVKLVEEQIKIKNGEIVALTVNRAKELEEKGFVKIIGG